MLKVSSKDLRKSVDFFIIDSEQVFENLVWVPKQGKHVQSFNEVLEKHLIIDQSYFWDSRTRSGISMVKKGLGHNLCIIIIDFE